MSQTLLFVVGVAVFAITLCAALLYGFYALDRVYQAEGAEGEAIEHARRAAETYGVADGLAAAILSS